MPHLDFGAVQPLKFQISYHLVPIILEIHILVPNYIFFNFQSINVESKEGKSLSYKFQISYHLVPVILEIHILVPNCIFLNSIHKC
jgi:hypothetical protein